MKDIDKVKTGMYGCCPGHDTFPRETYNSRRSKKARARDRKIEHQYIRSLLKRRLQQDYE